MNISATKKIYLAVIGLFLFMPLCATGLIHKIKDQSITDEDMIAVIKKLRYLADGIEIFEVDQYGLGPIHYTMINRNSNVVRAIFLKIRSFIYYRSSDQNKKQLDSIKNQIDSISFPNFFDQLDNNLLIEMYLLGEKYENMSFDKTYKKVKKESNKYFEKTDTNDSMWPLIKIHIEKVPDNDLTPKQKQMEKLAESLDEDALDIYEYLGFSDSEIFIESLISALVKDLKTLDVDKIKRGLGALPRNKIEKEIMLLLISLTSMDGKFLDDNLDEAIKMTDMLFLKAKSFGLEKKQDFIIELVKNIIRHETSVTYKKHLIERTKNKVNEVSKDTLKFFILLHEDTKSDVVKTEYKDRIEQLIKSPKIKIDNTTDGRILHFAFISEDPDVFKIFMEKMKKNGFTAETMFTFLSEKHPNSGGSAFSIRDYTKGLLKYSYLNDERFKIVSKQIESLGQSDSQTDRLEMSVKTKRNLKIFAGAFVVASFLLTVYKARHHFLRFFGRKNKLSEKELDAIASNLTNANQNMTPTEYEKYKNKIINAISTEDAKKVKM